jgi:hypothetical protein
MKTSKASKIIRRKELSAAISLVLAASPVAHVYAQDAEGDSQNEDMVMEEA